MELPLRHVDGTTRWLNVIAHPSSADARVFGVANDITERKRLERALARSHAYRTAATRSGNPRRPGAGTYWHWPTCKRHRDIGDPLRFPSQSPTCSNLPSSQRRAIETSRDIARGISPLTESRGSLVHSLSKLVERAAAGQQARISFAASENAPLILAWEARDHLYRIAQQALSNTLQHSGAKSVRISLQIDAQLVRLEVTDDGCGFDPGTAPKGLGIDGMRQRATAIGGRLTVASGEQSGSAVVCECQQPAVAAGKSG